MNDLNTIAALAEIFGAATILIGALFAAIQYSEYRARRRNEVAAELCRRFAEPELGRAITLLRRLPNGIALTELRTMDLEYEESAQIVAMAFETMGLLVHRKIAAFELIQELTGGLLLMMWRKIEVWVETTRDTEDNPRFAEYVQYLAERVATCESDMVPAYVRLRQH